MFLAFNLLQNDKMLISFIALRAFKYLTSELAKSQNNLNIKYSVKCEVAISSSVKTELKITNHLVWAIISHKFIFYYVDW